jgi:hypothetical protein
MKKKLVLDLDTGNLTINESTIAGKFTTLDSVQEITKSLNAKKYTSPHLANSYSIYDMECEFAGLNFIFGIKFIENICSRVVLRWQDGAAELLGYEASQEDLSKETKFLGASLAAYFGRKTDGKRKGDYIWHFPWGYVTVWYETKSNTCSTSIHYEAFKV